MVDGIGAVLEARVNLAVTLGIGSVLVFVGVQVGHPIIEGLCASERNIDRVVGGKESNKALSVVMWVVNSMGQLETCNYSNKVVSIIKLVSTVRGETELLRDFGLLVGPLVFRGVGRSQQGGSESFEHLFAQFYIITTGI